MNAATPAPEHPQEAADLVNLLGRELALALIEQRGGTRVHVPKPAGVWNSSLRDLLGASALLNLAKADGGCVLVIPLCKKWRVRLLLHAGGRSNSEIARLIGVTEGYVRKLSPPDRVPMPTTHRAGRAVGSLPALSGDLSDAARMLEGLQ